MANTTFEELYSDFLFKVQDYQHRNLYLRDEKVATNLCLSFLKTAIAKFTNCKKDIQNPNLDLCIFNVELSLVEKEILTNLMLEAWLNRVCLDITQMNLTLNDNDWAKALVWYMKKFIYFKPSNCWNVLKSYKPQHHIY